MSLKEALEKAMKESRDVSKADEPLAVDKDLHADKEASPVVTPLHQTNKKETDPHSDITSSTRQEVSEAVLRKLLTDE
jgi:hypothetical protein